MAEAAHTHREHQFLVTYSLILITQRVQTKTLNYVMHELPVGNSSLQLCTQEEEMYLGPKPRDDLFFVIRHPISNKMSVTLGSTATQVYSGRCKHANTYLWVELLLAKSNSPKSSIAALAALPIAHGCVAPLLLQHQLLSHGHWATGSWKYWSESFHKHLSSLLTKEHISNLLLLSVLCLTCACWFITMPTYMPTSEQLNTTSRHW